ncbi:hypothetical protein GBF38_019047 [Nibea albiflora]|uniref:Uncharacterized protein n=1 Tax=Nibea albiflora TaxID=240163 RepID=A0ACB7F6N9_NIBAL|nr:hypothetical protein GBF38_019047 [Nibea albiflora]
MDMMAEEQRVKRTLMEEAKKRKGETFTTPNVIRTTRKRCCCGHTTLDLMDLLADLSVFTMSFLEGYSGPDSGRKGEAVCHSASSTRSFFHRAPFSRPSSPHSIRARTSSFRMNSKTFFPSQSGPPQQDSPPKAQRRDYVQVLDSLRGRHRDYVQVLDSLRGRLRDYVQVLDSLRGRHRDYVQVLDSVRDVAETTSRF